MRLRAVIGTTIACATAAGAVAAAFVACSQIPTNPNTPFAIQVDTLPAPSVVAGDTMRDTTGTVQPIRVEVFNVQGHVLPNPHVRFLSFDMHQLLFDTLGHAIGAPTGDSTPQFVVDAQALQTAPQTLPVVLRPDSLLFADSDSVQTDTLQITGSSFDTLSLPLDATLHHNPDSAGADSVTRSYIVRYSIVYPAKAAAGTGTPSDTTLPMYVSDANLVPARVDTTDQNGAAARYVVFNKAKILPPVSDSVIVQLSARYRGAPVGGSPLRFAVHYVYK